MIHGKIRVPDENMIAECEACGCVFTFSEEEASRSSNNGGGSLLFVQCPEKGCFHKPYFDTGYRTGDAEKCAELNRSLKELHERLWALAKAS